VVVVLVVVYVCSDAGGAETVRVGHGLGFVVYVCWVGGDGGVVWEYDGGGCVGVGWYCVCLDVGFD
jgi:hypothetical protein